MPYFTEGGSKSPCMYQKKNLYNGQSCHIIPITKRPIEKVTTRSQAQYQQLIKTMGGAEALLADKIDGNNSNFDKLSRLYYLNKTGVSSRSTLNATTSQQTAIAGGRSKSKGSNSGGSTSGGPSVSASSSNSNSNSEEKIIPVTLVPASRGTTSYCQQQAGSSKLNFSTDTNSYVDTAPATNCLPFSPQDVLRKVEFSMHLTHYEKKEIIEYPEIYFIGKTGIKKRTPQTPTTTVGAHGFETRVYGFDDNSQSYIPVIHDHIAYRYEILSIIGKGTFGIVLQAYDHKLRCGVALKVIRNLTRFHTQAKEEIKILTKLLENDKDDKFNVVHMYDNFQFRHHPCIAFELLSLNLYELSKNNRFVGFSLPLIRRFTFAIVKCLHALSKYEIIHCDLKPENILLKQHNRSGIKVIDFGSSCFTNRRIHTYIQSRFYRSPEVILCGKYGPQIDMWSLGCILAELFMGEPLLSGENERDQLSCIMEIFDVPPPRFIYKCKSSKVRQFFDPQGNPSYCAFYCDGQYRPVAGRSQRGKIREIPGGRMLLPNCRDTEFVNFIRRCLVWDPAERMTPAEALKHPWLLKRTNNTSTDNAVSELTSKIS